jgi:hypothetical protein
MLWVALALLLVRHPQAPSAPVIDGRIDDAEWASAMTAELTGGGAMRILRRGDFLYVALRGPRSGLASLCAAKGSRVRILHASAAVGEARYERATGDAAWKQTSPFDFHLRDAPRAGRPTLTEYADYLRTAGWVANSSAAGSPEREFQIRADQVDALGVTFLATSDPMAISYWPPTIADDCRSVAIAQGYLPASASFDPAGWYRLQQR